MGSSANLEVLPAELQRGILNRITDMKTLHALICASPRFFQIYRLSKNAIMSQIVHNQMDPAYLPIAFDVHRLREITLDNASRDLKIAYWNSFGRRPYLSGPCSFSLSTSKALMSFHETVEYFISDYTQSRLSMIKRCLDFTDTQSSSHDPTTKLESLPVLSKTEYSRLARAFYHFELFACLFRMIQGPGDTAAGSIFLGLYLAHMRDWELEEFFCIWEYFIEKQDEYMHKFRRMSYLERSLVLGLKTTRTILTTTTPGDKTDTNREVGEICWSAEMEGVADHLTRRVVSMKCDDPNSENDIEKHNTGLSWATKDLKRVRRFIYKRAYVVITGLRRWGYAIWDHERLNNLDLLTKDVAEVSELCKRDFENLSKQRPKKEE